MINKDYIFYWDAGGFFSKYKYYISVHGDEGSKLISKDSFLEGELNLEVFEYKWWYKLYLFLNQAIKEGEENIQRVHGYKLYNQNFELYEQIN